MDNNEVKSAVETLGKTFSAFKEANDERLAQVESKGNADPVTEAKLSKIEKDMDKFADMEISMKAQADAQKKSAESMAKLETIISRPGFANDSKMESKHVQIFDKWLRKGKENLTPDELLETIQQLVTLLHLSM